MLREESRLKASEVPMGSAWYFLKNHSAGGPAASAPLPLHGDPAQEPQTRPAIAAVLGGSHTNDSSVPCLALPSPPVHLGWKKACLKKKKGGGEEGMQKGHRDAGMGCASHRQLGGWHFYPC